jgi:hypothetical protein
MGVPFFIALAFSAFRCACAGLTDFSFGILWLWMEDIDGVEVEKVQIEPWIVLILPHMNLTAILYITWLVTSHQVRFHNTETLHNSGPIWKTDSSVPWRAPPPEAISSGCGQSIDFPHPVNWCKKLVISARVRLTQSACPSEGYTRFHGSINSETSLIPSWFSGFAHYGFEMSWQWSVAVATSMDNFFIQLFISRNADSNTFILELKAHG